MSNDNDMKIHLLTYLLVLVTLGYSRQMELLAKMDLSVLEDKDYCAIVIDIEDFPYDWYFFIEGTNYISTNSSIDCWPILKIKRMLTVDFKTLSCDLRYQYIKNPNETLMFLNEPPVDVYEMLTEDFFQTFPCILKNQPYFYIVTKMASMVFVQEVQIYARKIVDVLQWKDSLKVKSINERRCDFEGAKIIAHIEDSNFPSFEKYNKELSVLFANHFNFTLHLIASENYGVKLDNGSFTGSIHQLQHNHIDIMMGDMFHTSERLEVTVAAFPSAIETGYRIFYWKNPGYKFIFGQIFHINLWICLFATIPLLSIYLLIASQLHQGLPSMSGTAGTPLINSLVINVQAFLASSSTSIDSRASTKLYLFSIGLCGALTFWCYTGLLTSYFTAESENQPIHSLKDLLGNHDFRLALVNTSASIQPYFTAIQEHPHWKIPLEESTVFYTSMSKLLDDFMFDYKDLIVLDDQIIFYDLARLKSKDKLCQIKSGHLAEAKHHIPSGWLYPQNSILIPLFDEFLLHLAEHGIDNKLKHEHFGFLDEINSCKNEYEPLEVGIVMVLFKALAGGAGLATLALLAEFVLLRWKKVQSK